MATRTLPSELIDALTDRVATRLRGELGQMTWDPPPAGTPETLAQAVTALRGCVGQTDALRSLLAGCGALGLRAALFVTRAAGNECWEGTGFGTEFPDGSPRGALLPADAPAVAQVLRTGRSLLAGAEGPGVPSFEQEARSNAVLVPLRVQDKTPALLYCDPLQPGGAIDRPAVELLVECCGLVIERQVLARMAALRDESTGQQPASAAAISGAFKAPAPSSIPTLTAAPTPSIAAAPVRAPEPATPGGGDALAAHAESSGSPEIDDARRFARLLMEEIYLYHADKIEAGRAANDILTRLGDEVERAKSYYEQRIPAEVRARGDFFLEALVRVLAAGRSQSLGEPVRHGS